MGFQQITCNLMIREAPLCNKGQTPPSVFFHGLWHAMCVSRFVVRAKMHNYSVLFGSFLFCSVPSGSILPVRGSFQFGSRLNGTSHYLLRPPPGLKVIRTPAPACRAGSSFPCFWGPPARRLQTPPRLGVGSWLCAELGFESRCTAAQDLRHP